MKTFAQFIVLTEKYSEEHAHRKLWNYFIAHPKHGKEVRDALLNKEYDKALELINTEVQQAKTDSKHPLNFSKAKRGFSVKQGKQSEDEESYNRELDDAIEGVHALASQKKMRGAVEKMHPARVTGGSDPNAKLSKNWKGAGGTNVTPKADLEIYNPKNPKERRGISMKKGGGAQLASAESGELLATYKAASKSYVQRFHGEKSKEERNKIQQDIMDKIQKVADMNVSMKSSSGDDEKESLKVSAQEIIDDLHTKHPQLTRQVSQVSTSGEKKFMGKNAPGTAGIVLTGKTSKTGATAKEAERQASAKPRQAKPKGSGRPGNVKVDYRPTQAQTKAQQTFKDFSAQTTAAQQALKDAETEKASAQKDLERNSDGTKTYLQHQAQKRINNPDLDARLTTADQAIQTAHTTLANVQAQSAQAKEKLAAQSQEQKPQKPEKESQPQRTEPVDTKPQQPQAQEKPEQKRRKKERTEAERADARRRMDAAGQAQGLPN